MSTNVGSVVASIVPDVSDFASRADVALTPSVERLGQKLGRTLSQSITRSLDFSGIDNALRRSLDVAEASAVSKGRQIGRRYGQAMRSGLNAELRGLQSLDVTIRPVIDRTAYRAVQADLDVLTRTRTVVITADADTTAAAARLADLSRNRTATISANVDSSQVARASSLISRITGVAASAGGAVGGLASKVALLGTAAPVVGSLVNVVAAIAPAAAVALPAVATLGSAIGAIRLGTSGLGDAFKEAFAPAASGASGAASATRQVEQAQRSLADAQRAVGDAQRQAAEQVEQATRAVADAQRNLKDAQEDAKQAQEDLTQAYEDGRRALQDMNLQLAGSKLDEEEAILRVAEAQEELDKVLANPKASELDRKEAKLRLDQANQGLKEQQVETKRLAEDTKKANKAGVEGTDQVKSARERLAQADQNVADKRRAVAGAESAVAKAQADGARQVADAQRAVADASRAVADAQAASAAQTAKLSENFSKLSPNAQGFVNAVKGLKPAWDSMQLGVQDRLFTGIGGRLTDVGSRVIPILRGGLEGTAGVLNRMGKSALTAVDNLAKTGMLKQILDGATQSLKPLEKAPGLIVTAFGQIAVAAQPAFQRITEGLGGAITKVTDKLGAAFESGAMEQAIDQAVSLLGDLMDVGQNVFSILGDIFMAGADSGGGTIQVLKTITEEISKITSSPEVQAGLKALFSVMGTLATTVAPLLGTALKFIGQIFEKLGPPVEVLVKTLGDALTPVIDALGPVLVIVADVLGKILVAISPLIPVIGELIAVALKPLGPIFEVVGDLIEALAPTVALLADALGPILTPILEGLGEVLTTLATEYAAQFMEILEELLPVIPELIPPLVSVGKSLGDLLLAIAPLLPQMMLLGAQMLTVLLPAILPLLPPILQLVDLLVRLAVWAIKKIVLPAIQGLIDYVKDMGRKLQPFIDAVKHVTEWIAKKVQWLYDRLVGGNSLIPDLIKKIRDWFNTGKRWIKDIWNAVWDNTIGRATSAGKTVGEKVSGFARGVRDRFGDAKKWAKQRWDDLWSGVAGTTTSIRKTVEGRVSDFKDAIVGFFKKAVEGVKTAWEKLRGIAKAPVKFLIQTVFNDGLRKVWNNTAAKLPGIGTISEMKLPKGFASGGILPGYTPGKDVHRFFSPTGGMLDLSGGEAIMRPEVTRAVGRGGINALNAAARQGGVQGVQSLLSHGLPHRAFWGGGIWDDLTNNPVTDSVRGAVGKGIDLLEKGADWARGGVADLAEKALKTLLGVKSLSVDTKNQIWSRLVGNIPVALADKIVDFIRGKEAETGGGGSWIKPVNAAYGTKFGVQGSMWSSGRHTGLDFPAAVGTAIKAVAAGRVSAVSRSGPYGNHLTVDHGGGLTSLYAHMSEIVARLKDTVAAGSLIGRVGATGNTTGPHLHLEARVNGKPVDPMSYLTGGGSSLNTPGSGVQRWAGVVRQSLGLVDQPSSLVQTTLRRMNQESGGNPRAVNKWDSNWQAGHPSVGLMQVIGPTFRAYAGRFKNKGPFLYGTSIDPLANVYSSMRYALAAYGSLSRAYNRPGGYAKGGSPSMGEWAWVGEEGPELVRFKRPAQVYPHQESTRIAQQMASTAQGLPSPVARDERVRELHLHTTTTEKPTKRAFLDAVSDYNALYGPQLAF
ncbi:peptidoglycan DD-metalloendopeptidase family protein [Streptomyces europaeiscabiei]|uniref:peptidoglycan DD-metalloendopeptidase family protein n=1 Tax=Streptomyces europaeiscabiei TaxID=146819 RepID=UPI0029BA5E90|nr:peptidoglycan DD-metalloendopeptidase family protein [Streptomyces europaeiscabiei]MDX3712728.1 peptidoglycan DD-metalloendopeptidase family protein [Streptomyces europaeiscabiei]